MSPKQSVYAVILHSRRSSMKVARYILAGCLVVLGLATIKAVLESMAPPLIYQRDLLQDYLIGKAGLTGLSPYLPLSYLAERFFPDTGVATLPHPTPHPPPVVFLGLPLAMVHYQVASALWFVLELLACGLTIVMLHRWLGLRVTVSRVTVATLIVLGWNPFLQEMIYGQLMVVVLMLMTVAGFLQQRGRSISSGIALGVALSLKLLGWPLLIFLALKKQWRSVSATVGTVVTLNLLAAVLLTPEVVADYYAHVARDVAPYYRAFAFNFSPWTLGWRLFEGTGSSVLVSFTAPPLIAWPWLAGVVSPLMVVSVLCLGLCLALKVPEWDVAYMILLSSSVLATPITWVHYFTWTLPPIAFIGKQLWDIGLPRRPTSLLLVIVVVLAIPAGTLEQLASGLSKWCGSVDTQVSFAAGLVTYLQPLAVMGLVWVLHRIAHQSMPVGT